jgi:hypothetical protein
VRKAFIFWLKMFKWVIKISENSATAARNEIFASLSEVYDSMERIDDSLIAIKLNEAHWAGILAGGLVAILWTFIGIPLLSTLFSPPPSASANVITVNYSFLLIALILLPTFSLSSGFLTYSYAKKICAGQFVGHKKILRELKKTIREQKVTETSVIEKTLQLMDQMSDWVTKLPKYKSDEAFAYGFAAFLIVAFVSLLTEMWSIGLPVSLLVGVLVWLYFRYEKRKEAEQQVQEFKTWKRKFEEGKSTFLETV